MVVDSLPALRVQPEEYGEPTVQYKLPIQLTRALSHAELRSPCFTRAASSSRLPQLPENVIALILDAQHFDDISETLGVSSTCRGFYQYGQR